MRVLVTGSSGLLGGAIAERLTAEHEVVGLDRVPGPRTTLLGGVEDRDLVRRAAAGGDAVIHTASLHAPDVGLMSRRAFVDVNVGGTLNLLEAAVEHRVRRFIYTSTTSLYGFALLPADRAVWVTEELTPRPRDIYDVTKLAAEQLCADVARRDDPPVICLRTARFFPEPPDVVAVNRLCRGVDLRDVVAAHLLALRDDAIPFGVFNISARSPFAEGDLEELLGDAPRVIRRAYPWAEQAFRARRWHLPASIDRVYVIAHAEATLGYRPRHNFEALFPERAGEPHGA